MSIHCDYGDYGDFDWHWAKSSEELPLDTKRSRKCCSCKATIKVGELTTKVYRSRPPNNEIEERIYGDEVPMSTWHLCETCGDLALSLDELDFCYSLGDQSLKDQIKEYREENP
jgi:hypothetical protein